MNVIKRESAPGELKLPPHDVMTDIAAPMVATRSARSGSVVVRYSRVERWDIVDRGRIPVWRRTAHLKLVLAALGGVGIGAAISLTFFGQPTTQVKARDASVTLSPAVVESAVPPVRALLTPVAAPPRPRAAPVRTATVAAASAATPAAAIERSGPDSEAAALAQAFSTDEAVSWHSAVGTGTVVVGVAAIENGKYCRDVAVLTRTEGAADRTVNGRKCLEPGGRITDQPVPAPQ